MTSQLSSEVVVIGGGPSGSISAGLLAEQGIDVLLIERDLNYRKPCGGGIPSSAFEEFAIPLDIVKSKVDTIDIFSPSLKRLTIGLRGGTINIVERSAFDRLLRDLAMKKGARVIEAEFISFIETSPVVRIRLRERRTVKDLEVLSRYAIIADGVNSKARRSLGLRPLRRVFTMSRTFHTPINSSCEFWFGSEHSPGFYSWLFPYSAGMGADRVNGIVERFKLFLRNRGIAYQGGEVASELGGTPEVPARGYFIPLWSKQECILQYGTNILLTGDAAGLVMPLTFEGIYYAMASGKLAAEAIINKRPSEYKRLWRERFLRKFSIMRFLWRYFLRNDSRIERLIEMHRIPEVQEIAMDLFLKKSLDRKSLNLYIGVIRRFLGINLQGIVS